MYVVGIVVVVQIWHALPESPEPRGTAALERSVYAELTTVRPVADVRCTRVERGLARCIATLPELGRTAVTARLDAASGAVRSVAIDAR